MSFIYKDKEIKLKHTQLLLMLKFQINKLLDLRLEGDKTNIYVNNRLFIQCKYLLLNLPCDRLEFIEDVISIDDTVEKSSSSLHFPDNIPDKIPPEVQFWGHCSNLQAWYENDYSSCLIHSNIAFPLLKNLAEAGDVKAKRVFKEEIAKRIENGEFVTSQFLIYNGYLDYLNDVELEYVLEQLGSNFLDEIIMHLENLLVSPLDNYRTIKDLIDLILFVDLKYNRNFLVKLIQNISHDVRAQCVRKVLLHLNYKEFEWYKIPYGKFFYYFESLITFLSENYPFMKDLLKILESGYYNSSLSLEEKFAYGSITSK
ncbi:MAG: hypothetical protein ACFFBI_02315 [Promethearchaeota archaeon]